MSLRGKLLLVATLLLGLPLAAIESTRQIENLLREARAQALLASASALARSLPESEKQPETGLYVNVLERPLQVDGYDEDWSQWRDWAQRLRGRQDHFDLTLQLAAFDRWVYLLATVRDRSQPRAAFGPGGLEPGDHLVLQLLDSRGLNQYQIGPGAAGGIEVAPSGQPGASVPPLTGAWRERESGDGYIVELRFPASLLRGPLTLQVIDSGVGPGGAQRIATSDHESSGHLIWRQPELGRQLARILAPGARGWLLHPQGWVLASGGEVASSGDQGQPAGSWQRLVYRLLAGDALISDTQRDPLVDLRLEGPEIDAARAGNEHVSWRRTASNRVVASAAVAVGQRILVVETPADRLLLATNKAARQVIGYSMLGVAVVVLGLLAYATVLSLRVRRLRDAAEALKDDDGGQIAVVLPGSDSRDELGDLARSYSVLLDELRAYNAYLRSLAGKLSHELNTPLAVVRSSLDNLAECPLEQPARDYALRARDGADRLAAILRAMSEARRLEQSLSGAESEAVDLCAIIRGCVAGYQAVDDRHHWTLALPPSAPLKGSPELLAQMLDKLADNARSFCPPGGTIRIALSRHRERWLLDFENDGPPLPERLGGQIFESLVSLRESRDSQLHLGLGLHIVRLVAQAHGGRVNARNRAADGERAAGVIFRIWLGELLQA